MEAILERLSNNSFMGISSSEHSSELTGDGSGGARRQLISEKTTAAMGKGVFYHFPLRCRELGHFVPWYRAE